MQAFTWRAFPDQHPRSKVLQKHISDVNFTTQPSFRIVLLTERRLHLNDGAYMTCSSCVVGDKERELPDLIETRESSSKEIEND